MLKCRSKANKMLVIIDEIKAFFLNKVCTLFNQVVLQVNAIKRT